jgi:hypothetical protein
VGAGSVKCPNDFLVLGTLRFCGTLLSSDDDKNNVPNMDEEITDSGSGPLRARFVSNEDEKVGFGFHLFYRMNHCFFGGK